MRKARNTKKDGVPVPAPAGVSTRASERPESKIQVVRLSKVTEEATDLLQEYYEAVGVVVRDTPEAVRQIVEDADGGVWLAYKSGEAVGCVYLHGLSSIPLATECKRLYVKPSARGQGVAHRLLDALEAYAVKRGFKRIYLDSKDDLKVAIAFYAKRGFTACERYNDNPQATIFLVKAIGDESPSPATSLHRNQHEQGPHS